VLIATLQAATAQLREPDDVCLDYVTSTIQLRPGLPELIETAERLDIQRHVVSYGFDFYVGHYLRQAWVEGRVDVHCGETAVTPTGRTLTYHGPDGDAVDRDFKMLWTRWLRTQADVLVYAGDGGSDVAPARLCDVVFARESLLAGLPPSFAGAVKPFETLHDVARGLQELYGD
jgi:2-hydroxy-3-keto-5-methylthiopentenyl-1-phosphate phosphatase